MSRRFEGSKTFLKASPFFCFLYRLHQISAGWEALKNILYLAKRVGQNLSWDYLQQYFDFRYKTMDLYNPCWFQMQGVTDLPPGIRPRKGKSLLLNFYLPLRLSLLFLYRTHAPRKIIFFQARHDVVISPWGFISAEFFYFHACKKNMVIWEQLNILVTNVPGWIKLSTSSWASQGAQPHCQSRCAHLTLQFGQQQSWLEQTSRQVQDNNLPTKTDIPGSNSHPCHAQALS